MSVAERGDRRWRELARAAAHDPEALAQLVREEDRRGDPDPLLAELVEALRYRVGPEARRAARRALRRHWGRVRGEASERGRLRSALDDLGALRDGGLPARATLERLRRGLAEGEAWAASWGESLRAAYRCACPIPRALVRSWTTPTGKPREGVECLRCGALLQRFEAGRSA